MEQRRVVVIGAPSGAAARGVGQEQTPTADWHVATIDIEG